MPILKVRQTNDTWFDIRKLTLDELDLGNGIKLSSKVDADDNNKYKLFVNEQKILNGEDKINLENSIKTNADSINAIKKKLTEFYEINSDNDGKLNLTDYLKENTRIHAFVNFNEKKPVVEYGTTNNYIVKGDDINSLEKATICEMDAYNYNGKFYIIWKNWG